MQLSEQIASFPWSGYLDAYGKCRPEKMVSLFTQLASDDLEECETAIFGFWSNLCHQGDIYCATAQALPFLVQVGLANDTLLQTDFLELIADMATSAAATVEKVDRKWARRVSESPGNYQLSIDELSQLDFDDVWVLRTTFVENTELLNALISKFENRSPEFAGQLRRKLVKFCKEVNANE